MSESAFAVVAAGRTSSRSRDWSLWLALGALVVAGLIPVIWPGDAPFINDEPQLIASAVAASHRGRLAPLGLLGTYGFRYGPAPTWVYQGLLALTHDLVGVATLHVLLMSAVTAAALWWLGRSLRLWMWFAPVPLLSADEAPVESVSSSQPSFACCSISLKNSSALRISPCRS